MLEPLSPELRTIIAAGVTGAIMGWGAVALSLLYEWSKGDEE